MALQKEAPREHRVWQGSRLRPPAWTEGDLLCSMAGHHAIAQAALRAPVEPDAPADVSEGNKEALQSLLQDMKVTPLDRSCYACY